MATLAMWALLVFAIYANLRPDAARALVGDTVWAHLNAAVDAVERFIMARRFGTQRKPVDVRALLKEMGLGDAPKEFVDAMIASEAEHARRLGQMSTGRAAGGLDAAGAWPPNKPPPHGEL